MTKARPILMSAPMVRALLEGRKTQTRRLIKDPDDGVSTTINCGEAFIKYDDMAWETRPCPYGKIGDLLWVRETSATIHITGEPAFVYKATDQRPWKYKPSIHMPRRASRLTLEITETRVQRLQDINNPDCRAEGYPPAYHQPDHVERTHKDWYAGLWNSINGAGAWDKNPWVWAITFIVHQKNVDARLLELSRC